jgi:hypothetical protein
MSANTNPIWSKIPHVGTVLIPQANAVVKSDGTSAGTGADIMYCVFKAEATNGSYVKKIRFMPTSATASTATTPTVLRVFVTTASQTEGAASGATTNANTTLLGEISTPAITADAPTAAVTPFELSIDDAIAPGQSILVCQHVAMASACFWKAIVFGGDY